MSAGVGGSARATAARAVGWAARRDDLTALARSVAQKVQRVAPPGSIVVTDIADRGVMRYTNQGAGPCPGALNGAVNPVPDASTSHGHPPSAHTAATRAIVSVSVIFSAVPSITRSNSWAETLKL